MHCERDVNDYALNWTRHAVCKVYHTKIKYLWNTTNLRNCISRFHAERLLSMLATAKETEEPVQPRIDAKQLRERQ